MRARNSRAPATTSGALHLPVLQCSLAPRIPPHSAAARAPSYNGFIKERSLACGSRRASARAERHGARGFQWVLFFSSLPARGGYAKEIALIQKFDSKHVTIVGGETPLGKRPEVKPGVTLDVPAHCLNSNLSGTLNALRSDECIGLVD